jgi:hypothetical protein
MWRWKAAMLANTSGFFVVSCESPSITTVMTSVFANFLAIESVSRLYCESGQSMGVPGCTSPTSSMLAKKNEPIMIAAALAKIQVRAGPVQKALSLLSSPSTNATFFSFLCSGTGMNESMIGVSTMPLKKMLVSHTVPISASFCSSGIGAT